MQGSYREKCLQNAVSSHCQASFCASGCETFLTRHLKPPCRTPVTTLARREVIAAKGALSVVASRATRSTQGRVMIQSQRCRYFPSARQTGPDLMTCSTRQLLRRIMTGVTEPNPISRCLLGTANQTPELMAGAARCDIASVCLCVRRVTTETGDVRIQS